MRILKHLLFLITISCSALAQFPQNGLVLHLDSSQLDTIEFDRSGKVLHWIDLSGNGNDATAETPNAPVLIKKAIHEKDAIRFSGSEWLSIPQLSENASGYSIFIVYQRTEGQASDSTWQRLISSTNAEHPNDTKEPAFHLTPGESGGARELQISYDLFRSDLHEPMTLGARHDNKTTNFRGDIAEVLIYDRSFIVFEPIEAIQNYLYKKWGITPNSANDWTHKGPLPDNLPERINGDFPLSDQSNSGMWKPYEAMWDEFNDNALDESKWWDHNPRWYGRAPSRYLGRNVAVSDGMLQLTMSKDTSIPEERLYRNNTVYKDYIAASVVSKDAINYGYFEIRAKPMPSAASSAWWFTANSYDKQEKKGQRLEIDVFEIGAKAKNKEYSYNMNLHSFKSAKEAKHYSIGGTWKAEEKLMDRFWIFGLEWTQDEIVYYVDGYPVRRVKNDRWHGPQYMIFDTETMVNWLGMPEDSDLPSIFLVDYVRSWTNLETENDWSERYEIDEGRGRSRITDYVRSMDLPSDD
ncbi:MAG: family 16 glycosylhydrolase [Opitutaceae bacterium]